MNITKAIIPVAGWGTRRLPITKAIEKCMLPVGNRPLVDYVVRDCMDAGITDIYFIVGEDSSQLRAYYENNEPLNTYLTTNNKSDLLALVIPPNNIKFHYIVQPKGKYGTAIPVSLVMPEISHDESVAVLMGDVFIHNEDGSSELSRLIAATPKGGNSLLGAHVSSEQISLNGILEVDESNRFIRIVEKPTLAEAPGDLANTSRYIFNYQLMTDIANYATVELSGEYYITEPINQYVLGGGVVRVITTQGEFLDGGVMDGWLHANNVVHGSLLV